MEIDELLRRTRSQKSRARKVRPTYPAVLLVFSVSVVWGALKTLLAFCVGAAVPYAVILVIRTVPTWMQLFGLVCALLYGLICFTKLPYHVKEVSGSERDHE